MIELIKKSDSLKKEYENHFNTTFPERIVGWWNPVNITAQEMAIGIKAMEKDIKKAIRTDTPIEEMPEELWKTIIF
ncbi:TPA: hypothetical protein ACGBG5_003229 [Enterococcus faecalis]